MTYFAILVSSHHVLHIFLRIRVFTLFRKECSKQSLQYISKVMTSKDETMECEVINPDSHSIPEVTFRLRGILRIQWPKRHFASTIFADQILIVGWRLSKEAWPPVGSHSATRCTNALVFFVGFEFGLTISSTYEARWSAEHVIYTAVSQAAAKMYIDERRQNLRGTTAWLSGFSTSFEASLYAVTGLLQAIELLLAKERVC